VVDEYRDRLPKMSISAQKEVLRKLVEAGDADSMLQLVFNEAVSVHDVNDLLEAIDPFDCENMIFECQGAATQGQVRNFYSIACP
jgi:flagellar biosynthesis component FlhA